MELCGPWTLAVCRAHQGLPDRFLSLRCSVLIAVESLSLLYLLIISWFMCSGGWCVGGLGSFLWAIYMYLCVLIHIWFGGGFGGFIKIFTDHSGVALLLWIFYVFFLSCICYAFASVYLCLVVAGWERAALLSLVCGV